MTRGQVSCVVEVSPQIVDAGAEMTLCVTVSCDPASDLRGHSLSIKDQAFADAGSIELTEFDGETNEAGGELVVKAPLQTGACTWSALSPAVVKKSVAYAEASAPISFAVKPHTTSVVAWDTPSAIVAREKFRMKVGIKCSSECDLTNRHFSIYNHEGQQVAGATLSGERWPGTAGLHFAEVELEAPASEGLYTWSVNSPGSSAGIPHDEGSISFGVRVVGRPECLVTVETVDRENQTPLGGARVVMHPYRAITDERGMAEVRVAKGAYRLFVSQTNYLTFGQPLDVTADMTDRVELELEPVTERN